MKHFRLFKNISLSALALAAVAVLGSCSHAPSPAAISDTLKRSTSATVFSYNDTCSPKVRTCEEAGKLPDRAARALVTWLHESTPKSFSYTYPQYYLSVQSPSGRTSVWGICSDCNGNLVGVMVPRGGVPAWDIPYASEQIVYVCDTDQRKDLSKAIMDSIADEKVSGTDLGYDEYRLATRRACGLTKKDYLISKPLSDEALKRRERLQQARKAAEEAQANGAATEAPAADGGADDFDLGGGDDEDDSASDDSDSADSADAADSDDEEDEDDDE